MLEALTPLHVLIGLVLLACCAAAAPPLPDEVEPYPVVADIAFAEGPIFDRGGNLYFVNYHVLGTMGRRTPDGTVEVWVHTGGQANGQQDRWRGQPHRRRLWRQAHPPRPPDHPRDRGADE